MLFDLPKCTYSYPRKVSPKYLLQINVTDKPFYSESGSSSEDPCISLTASYLANPKMAIIYKDKLSKITEKSRKKGFCYYISLEKKYTQKNVKPVDPDPQHEREGALAHFQQM